jgi:hypothetical protein
MRDPGIEAIADIGVKEAKVSVRRPHCDRMCYVKRRVCRFH